MHGTAWHVLSTVVHTALWEGIETYRRVHCCNSIVCLLQDVVLENGLLSVMCKRVLEIWILVYIRPLSSLSPATSRPSTPPILVSMKHGTLSQARIHIKSPSQRRARQGYIYSSRPAEGFRRQAFHHTKGPIYLRSTTRAKVLSLRSDL